MILVWETDPPRNRTAVGLLSDPTLQLKRLRDEFASLEIEERQARAAEFRDRMNALFATPGDRATLWNLRFAPLMRTLGVASLPAPEPPPAGVGQAAPRQASTEEPLIRTESAFLIARAGQLDVRVTATPFGVRDVMSTVYVYSLAHTDLLQCELWLAWASNGERWVQAENVLSPLPLLHKLDGRFRLSIGEEAGSSNCPLFVARPKPDGRVSLIRPSMRELSDRTDVSVPTELRHVGAIDVGSRESVLGDSGRNRKTLVATFSTENEDVPVLAYALTRFAPLLPEISG
jgi:hypothetical protein